VGRGRRSLERQGEQGGSTRDIDRVSVRSPDEGERLGAGDGSIRSEEGRAQRETRRVAGAVDRQLEGPRPRGKRHPFGGPARRARSWSKDSVAKSARHHAASRKVSDRPRARSECSSTPHRTHRGGSERRRPCRAATAGRMRSTRRPGSPRSPPNRRRRTRAPRPRGSATSSRGRSSR